MKSVAGEHGAREAGSRRRWPLWPGMIFVLLGLNMAVVVVTVVAAISTRTPVVIADEGVKESPAKNAGE